MDEFDQIRGAESVFEPTTSLVKSPKVKGGGTRSLQQAPIQAKHNYVPATSETPSYDNGGRGEDEWVDQVLDNGGGFGSAIMVNRCIFHRMRSQTRGDCWRPFIFSAGEYFCY